MKTSLIAIIVILGLVVGAGVASAQRSIAVAGEGAGLLAAHPLDDHWGETANGGGLWGSRWIYLSRRANARAVYGIIARTNPGAFSSALPCRFGSVPDTPRRGGFVPEGAGHGQ